MTTGASIAKFAPPLAGRRRLRDRGSILIVVLWIVLILALMVSTFAVTMQIETRLVSHHERALQAKAIAMAGIEYEKALLALDLNPPSDINSDTQSRRSGGLTSNATARSSTKQADYYSEPWHNNPDLIDHPLGDGSFTVQVIDEQSRLNANVMQPEQWKTLLQATGVDSETSTIIADSVGDWIDKDSNAKLNGAEDDYYVGLPPEQGGPYHCKNGAMDRLEELLLIRGMTPDIFYGHQAEGTSDASLSGIGRFLSVCAFNKININTAPSEVLQCIPGVSADMAEQLIRYRAGDDGIDGTDDDKPFEEAGEVATVWGGVGRKEMTQWRKMFDVKTSFFTIRSTGTIGSTRVSIVTTVYRSEDGTIVPITYDQKAL